MSAKIGRNVLGNVLGHTSAMLLWLSVNHRCLKYKKREKQMKRERESGRLWEWDGKWFVLSLSCTSGWVKREEESGGERREEMTKGKWESQMCGWQVLWCGRSTPIQAWMWGNPYSGQRAHARVWTTWSVGATSVYEGALSVFVYLKVHHPCVILCLTSHRVFAFLSTAVS